MNKPKYYLQYSQIGIPYIGEYAYFAVFYLNSTDVYDTLKDIATRTLEFSKCKDYKTGVVTGIDYELWSQWCQNQGISIPKGIAYPNILEVSPPYKKTGGELFFHIKSDNETDCHEVLTFIEEALSDVTERVDHTLGSRRHGGKVYGGRMFHGIINTVDPINMSNRVIVGDEDPKHKGALYLVTQRFVHDWEKISNMTEIEIESMIGRNKEGNIIPTDYPRSHIKCVRVDNKEKFNYRIMPQGHPYGESSYGKGKEKGVYAAAYANDTDTLAKVLQSMVGDQEQQIKDEHLNVSTSDAGNFWYIPSAAELGLAPHTETLSVPINSFFQERSKNGYMFYNAKDYLHQMGNVSQDCPLSERVIELLGIQFSRWHETWYKRRHNPPLGHITDHLSKDEGDQIMQQSVAIRKGMAIKLSLSKVLTSKDHGNIADVFRIDPKELIVGVLPNLTLGMGKEVMTYLSEEERLAGFLVNLNEYSAMGHNLPGHQVFLDKGIGCLLAEVNCLLQKTSNAESRDFYQSVIYSLEGVQAYCLKYAALASNLRDKLPASQMADRQNLFNIAERMEKLSVEKPSTFLEAMQMIFIVHCCLHLTGEPVSIGRLDQFVYPFYHKDTISKDEAQEIIDCFWIKMDEKVLYNRKHFEDKLNYGTGAVSYAAGNFPQGGGVNQWVQQVTVGGYQATEDKTPKEAYNTITKLCLKSARRLPFNAPVLSLRVHKGMPDDLIEEAAKAILSGGAHPVLLNDDKFIQGLMDSGQDIDSVKLSSARNFACDGCYEPLFAGQSEFAFSYIPLLNAVELSLNQGILYASAGPIHIKGLKTSYVSPPASDIKSFEQLLDIFYQQYAYLIAQFYDGIVSKYGSLWEYCPSPLLSACIDGCLETGRDLSNGGAQYHILAPMIQGFSHVINSLYNIKKMVFDEKTAVTTLPELVECLICDWGYEMIEPFQSSLAGPERAQERAKWFKDLREIALKLPKFGAGDKEVDELGVEIVTRTLEVVHKTIRHPIKEIQDKFDHLVKKYSVEGQSFEFVLTPGSGTFESYVGLGINNGASADGRRKGMPYASDFSPNPSPQDLPVDHAPRNIFKALEGYNFEAANSGLANGSEVDINIREDFPLEDLVKVIKDFSEGKIGTNLLTITCADPETFEQACTNTEKYDLIRVRMGGWTEFFVAMFPAHQEQHKRRPIFTH